MIKVLFRMDAGPSVGLGHLQRSLSLATALHQLGTVCVFLTNGNRSVQGRLAAAGFKTNDLVGVKLGGAEDLKRTIAVAGKYRCDAVVVDSYRVEASYLACLRAAEFFVVAIDDLAPYPFPCQLVVNGGVHADTLSYRSPVDTIFLLGPKYLLLRSEFSDVPPRRVREKLQLLLVTLGGADLYNLTPRIIELLDDLPGDFTVAATLGPFFANQSEVRSVAKRCRRFVRLVDGPDCMRDLMLEADLAISAGGQTLCELAATGTPTVAIQVADNQMAHLRTLARMGLVRLGGNADQEDMVLRLAHIVQSMSKDWQERSNMSVLGPCLVDGRGAVRVAKTILKRASSGGSRPRRLGRA